MKIIYYSRSIRVSMQAPESVVAYARETLVARLNKDIAGLEEGGVLYGSMAIKEGIETVAWNPDVVDEDGEPFEFFEPYQLHLITAEQGVWWDAE